MKKMTSQEIRETWLNFFKERGHMIEPGASLIPVNDPSLLWINAGVAALKNILMEAKFLNVNVSLTFKNALELTILKMLEKQQGTILF